MKRVLKQPSPLVENLVDEKRPQRRNFSVYLDTESLQYLDKLCVLFNKGRSAMVKQLILNMKNANIGLVSMLGDDKSDLAEAIRKMAFGPAFSSNK